ncbi:class I SAM-dependent methyltransferase [uncultured Sphaerochaeta sp.]|uniref:class I SAM-dependent methyltransferase n=1 Tax=uncultured Sphaerochaeta sp. TaxID=886478 RepID=UPI002A0A6C98|nr:class I SAM-dependent methyltransferase [uncultured Sphaerochaeta sp.]
MIPEEKSMIVRTLRTIGVKKNQTILDFGCGIGTFSIPAAEISGSAGIVYSVDRDESKLKFLKAECKRQNINNCVTLNNSDWQGLRFPNDTFDFILLYDVLHSYYFKDSRERVSLLHEVKRVAKNACIISIYPKHMKISTIIQEFNNMGISLIDSYLVDILHYGQYEYDYVYNFGYVQS